LDIPPGTVFIDDAPRGCLASITIAILILIKEWVTRLAVKTNLTFCILDGCHHELSFNPKKYRYGGPKWFAHLIGILFPSPDLWILLDIPANVSQSNRQNYLPTETIRQREAYRAFVKTKTRYIILDAERSQASVTEEAYAAIIDALTLRTDKQLRNRF
jgi:hypothetical protein